MRNVEIKARVPAGYQSIMRLAEKLSESPPTTITQRDTFYRVNKGLLKMRFYQDESATLIRYDRNIEEGPKLSDYDLLEFPASEANRAKKVDEMFQKSLGLRAKVVKIRQLFMIGQTRVHIDRVTGLEDTFMELEVVLREDQTLEEGQNIAKDLQKKLGITDKDLIDCSYMELLERKSKDIV